MGKTTSFTLPAMLDFQKNDYNRTRLFVASLSQSLLFLNTTLFFILIFFPFWNEWQVLLTIGAALLQLLLRDYKIFISSCLLFPLFSNSSKLNMPCLLAEKTRLHIFPANITILVNQHQSASQTGCFVLFQNENTNCRYTGSSLCAYIFIHRFTSSMFNVTVILASIFQFSRLLSHPVHLHSKPWMYYSAFKSYQQVINVQHISIQL